jgi:replication factor C subunit 2/4
MELAEPWVEKYRPKNVSSIVGQGSHLSRFRIIIQDHSFPFPNVVMVGPPGVGKTTTATCVAREYLEDRFEHAFTELNGSDDRTSKVLSDKLVPFCRKPLRLPPHTFRIALIDEIDSMVPSAQQTLKCIMEEYAAKVRFFLVANTESKLIRELYSQCVVLRYSLADKRSLRLFLEDVCDEEKVEHTREGIEALIDFANGDIRRSVNDLQSVATAWGDVTKDHVQKLCTTPPLEMVKSWSDEEDAGVAISILENMLEQGYSVSDIYQAIVKVSKTEEMHAYWLMQVGEMVTKPQTLLQLAALTYKIK